LIDIITTTRSGKFEDIKGNQKISKVTRRNSKKHRKYNGETKMDKRPNND
jgi:hypothetical protein